MLWASLVAQLVKNLPAMQKNPVRFLGGKDPLEKGEAISTPVFLVFPSGSVGKESTCSVRDLGWEDPLEKGMATHSSMLAWRIPMDCIVHGVAKSQTWLRDFNFQTKKSDKETNLFCSLDLKVRE